MSRRRSPIRITAAFTALAVLGSMSTAAPAFADCKPDLRTFASSAAMVRSTAEARAKRRAIRRWERRAERLYGCLYADYSVAQNKSWVFYRPNGYLHGEPCRKSGVICS